MKDNILSNQSSRQWLDLGLDGLPPLQAERVRLFRLLLATSGALRSRLDRALAPSGVTSQQGGMLQWIEAQPGPPTISAVAAGLGMTLQNVKQIATALARKGFVEIVVDAHDRRSRRLVLTARHRDFWQQRNPLDFGRIEQWLAALDDAEVASMVALLHRTQRHLESQDAAAPVMAPAGDGSRGGTGPAGPAGRADQSVKP